MRPVEAENAYCKESENGYQKTEIQPRREQNRRERDAPDETPQAPSWGFHARPAWDPKPIGIGFTPSAPGKHPLDANAWNALK